MTPLGLGLGLGFGSSVGDSQAVNPTLPQSANILKAYSLRRLVAAFGNGKAGMIDRISPITSGWEEAYFNDSGTITVAAGIAAKMYEIYNHAGSGALGSTVFETSPQIFNGISVNKGLSFIAGDLLTKTEPDTALNNALRDFGGTISLWIKTSYTTANTYAFSISTPDNKSSIRLRNSTGNVECNVSSIACTIANDPLNPTLNGQWHMITVTFSEIVAGQRSVKAYFDGKLKTTTAPTLIGTTVGDYISIGGFSSTGTYEGIINDVMIYKGQLTGSALGDGEIGQLYSALLPYYL